MLSKWIYTAATASLACAVCLSLAPDDRTGKALKFICGIVMISVVLSPIVSLDMDKYSISAAKYKLEAEKILSTAEETRAELNRTVIENECSAYILDKAGLYGITLQKASVVMRWCSEGYWYPYEAEIIICTDDYGKDVSVIENVIEAELGIPKERQAWKIENAEDS